MPIADARLTGKVARVAALAGWTRASLPALANRTRASPAARADWEQTPTLKRDGGDRERFVLTLRSIEGTKPNLAKLTIARKIAAIALSMWKSKEKYDPTKHRKQG